ncbi:hypothetical protein JRQ81_015567 [Phrynocephalus forsythii]|uniref:CYTH domain-containing protein n=1 Tax=Phrynocephalus forsythii TaxID=171643 RepID=A0A9Q0XU58_9SAUR|nr:hypothetical protein JRQ81_015567 [Phrynocephalus forsythii]
MQANDLHVLMDHVQAISVLVNHMTTSHLFSGVQGLPLHRPPFLTFCLLGRALSQMPANVEIKARVRDLDQLTSNAERLSGLPGSLLLQTDTFFSVPHGRLKLRDFRDGHGQLVFYDRPDTEGPKVSHYTISHTDDPAGLLAALSQALGVQGTVKKERRLYMVGQTRVHVDRVEGLGDFMELEVVLQPEQSPQEGEEVAQRLMAKLGVRQEDLISGAYLDLLQAGGQDSP